MKTKILYVLVSTPKDIYLEQAYVSISSLRHHCGKDAHIVVLMDTITESTLNHERNKMLGDVDEIISVELPIELSAQNRSRILKTSARKHVKGDFLFIDCDTIITKPLDSIDAMTADIAACYDSHCEFKDNPYREMCIDHCKKLGIDITGEEKYYNSGVIYVKDTPAAHDFYEMWNRNWLKGREVGVNMDQPAFNKTNIELGYKVHTLSDVWNCEFIHGIRFLKDAKIVHYLCTNVTSKNQESFILRDKENLLVVKQSGIIPSTISDCFDDPFCGIPALTTLIAGKEMYARRMPLFQSLIFHSNSRGIRTINKIYTSIKGFLAELKRRR
ncbi:MAG: hypothetical protein K2M53_12710 [Muribaculaceae bacterium]|nr:hypothetical protein [Muribaculaceae bacterium]